MHLKSSDFSLTEAAKMVAQGIAEVASLGAGSVVVGTAGAATAVATDTNNWKLHPDEGKFIDKKGRFQVPSATLG